MASDIVTSKLHAKRGPKPIEIDWDEFDKLCAMQCTLKEIAAWFNCSPDTIENRCKEVQGEKFSDYYEKKSAYGKISLRRKQFQIATEGRGSVPMAIWLGKQYLGQSDKIDSTTTAVINGEQPDKNAQAEENIRAARERFCNGKG